MAEPAHSELIRDQFTRQAGVFNAAATITNEQALKMIVAVWRARRTRFWMWPAAAELLFVPLHHMWRMRPASI